MPKYIWNDSFIRIKWSALYRARFISNRFENQLSGEVFCAAGAYRSLSASGSGAAIFQGVDFETDARDRSSGLEDFYWGAKEM